MKKNKRIKRTMFAVNKYFKFVSVNLIKLLSINVKKVKKPIAKVIINSEII